MRLSILLSIIILMMSTKLSAQNCTDVSMFLNSDSSQFLTAIGTESGDLYYKLGHHGPAIENEYLGLRIFFNATTAVDVYSKTKKGLEFERFQWYPTPEEQAAGWGVDMYKVGKTVGLGGIRLWDGEKVLLLDPVSERTAAVHKGSQSSYMEMISRGVPYKGETVDIKVRVTVFCDKREALIEAEEMNGKKVQFVTGVNYHPGNHVQKGEDYISVWGIHPEDVAANPVGLGGAIIFNPKVFSKQIDDGKEVLLISKARNKVETYITSSNANESEINTAEKFIKYVEGIQIP